MSLMMLASGSEISPVTTWSALTTAVVLIIGAAIYALKNVGILKMGKEPSEWAAEVELAERRGDRLESENARLASENKRLHETRSMEPVLEMLTQAATIQSDTAQVSSEILGKLHSFNGTLQYLQEGFETICHALDDATSGLQTVVALIMEIHDIPIEAKRGRNLLAHDEGTKE